MQAPAFLKFGVVVAVAFSASAGSAQIVLEGDLLRIGVHSSGGLIDNCYDAGIAFRPSSSEAWNGDFLRSSTNLEFYALGYNGTAAANGYFVNMLSATTQQIGSTLSTETVASYNELSFRQVLTFDPTNGLINFSVTLTNESAGMMEGVMYARGLDAGQDWYLGAPLSFLNTINEIKDANGQTIVSSLGGESKWKISIIADSDSNPIASIRADWNDQFDLLSLLNALDHGAGNPGSPANHTINMAWNIGTLAAGASATIHFQYKIERVTDGPGVPEETSTLVLLTLVGLAGSGVLARRFRRT
jgi:hypothetical protein